MAVSDNTVVEVRNLVDHKVVYKIPEENIRREFFAFEVKKVKASELRKLNYQYGGRVLLHEYLNVGNPELAKEFGIDCDDMIEYNWSEADVDRVLTTGSLDELMDALDFAPQGIVELIKDRAIELRIPDISKRKAIVDATGCDINNTIDMLDAAEKEDNQKEDKPVKERRSKQSAGSKGGRRVKQEA